MDLEILDNEPARNKTIEENKTPSQSSSEESVDSNDEQYFSENIDKVQQEPVGYGSILQYKNFYKNFDHNREFRGAMTNQASFDNQELNGVAYIDGQITSSTLAPNLLKLQEEENTQKLLMLSQKKSKRTVNILLENTVVSDHGPQIVKNKKVQKIQEKLHYCHREFNDCKDIMNRVVDRYSNQISVQNYIENEREKDLIRQAKAMDIGNHFKESRKLFEQTDEYKNLQKNVKQYDGSDVIDSNVVMHLRQKLYAEKDKDHNKNIFLMHKLTYRSGKSDAIMTDKEFNQKDLFKKVQGFYQLNKKAMKQYKEYLSAEKVQEKEQEQEVESSNPSDESFQMIKKQVTRRNTHNLDQIKEHKVQHIRQAMSFKCKECQKSRQDSCSSSDSEIKKRKRSKKSMQNKDEDDEVINPYPEIKIPQEYVIKFEADKEMDFGSLIMADRHIQDEMRIRYLQMQHKHIVDFHEREMREMQIRLRNTMHGYARACLEIMNEELKHEYKLMFLQFDKFKEQEKQYKEKIKSLEQQSTRQENIITQLLSFIKWEETAHDQFTIGLKNQGISQKEISETSVQQAYMKEICGLKRYYKNFDNLTDKEQYNLDLTKPFSLYTNSIRLSTFERLNILERETVQAMYGKLKYKIGEVQFYESQCTSQENFYKILNQEKNKLRGELLLAEAENDTVRYKWETDVKDRVENFNKTILMYQERIKKMAAEQKILIKTQTNEIKVLREIIEQNEQLQKKMEKEIQSLKIQLRTPRYHIDYLRQKGKLDEFVEAKVTGQEPIAKWHLLESAQNELEKIEHQHQQKLDFKEKKGLTHVSCPTIQSEQNSKQYMITTSYTKDLNQDSIKDINFFKIGGKQQFFKSRKQQRNDRLGSMTFIQSNSLFMKNDPMSNTLRIISRKPLKPALTSRASARVSPSQGISTVDINSQLQFQEPKAENSTLATSRKTTAQPGTRRKLLIQ